MSSLSKRRTAKFSFLLNTDPRSAIEFAVSFIFMPKSRNVSGLFGLFNNPLTKYNILVLFKNKKGGGGKKEDKDGCCYQYCRRVCR